MIFIHVHLLKLILKKSFLIIIPLPNFTEINKKLYHLCRNTTIHSYNMPYILLKLYISKAHRIPHTSCHLLNLGTQ